MFLTRFNLPTPGPESLVRAQDGWLRTRWELFTRFTVPAMRAQTERRFRWIVYYDPASPAWLREAVSAHEAEGIYAPVYREQTPVPAVIEDIRRIAPPAHELLTTNLDNDDGLAEDFAERLRAHRPPAPRSAIYLTEGLIRSGDGLYLRRDRDNAFCSVREPWDDPLTCWCDWHVLLGTHMATSEIDGAPAWLQVVHGTNVSNRVRGALVDPSPFRARFPGLLDDLLPPGAGRRLADRALRRPLREGRDAMRLGLKKAIMLVGGKAALERAKTAAKLRGRHAA